MAVNRAEHWEQVYQTKGPEQVSWFQAEARLSRQLIESQAPARSSAIIDIGAGASTLVDGLLDAEYSALTVLDLSVAALQLARTRLGDRASRVDWRAADILEASLEPQAFDVWHDRAVFHFLTDPVARAAYVEQVRRAVKPGGHVMVATFGLEGPLRCSGLDVARYDHEGLHAQFGDQFELLRHETEDHVTPAGKQQEFVYCLCKR